MAKYLLKGITRIGFRRPDGTRFEATPGDVVELSDLERARFSGVELVAVSPPRAKPGPKPKPKAEPEPKAKFAPKPKKASAKTKG